jgi:hypothetical protein
MSRRFVCGECDKGFESKDSMESHKIHKHMNKEERKVAFEQSRKHKDSKNAKQKVFSYIMVILIALVVLYGAYTFLDSTATVNEEGETVILGGTYTGGEVHWHSTLAITVCGENVELPQPSIGSDGSVHGQSYVGTPNVHLHTGPKVHVEGNIQKAEDISLGVIMENLGLKYSTTELLDKVNGDLCPDGSEGTVQLKVNEKDNSKLSNYVLADGESYELIFE